METIKTGIKTSEFWVTLVAAFLMVANKGLGLDIDEPTVLGFAGLVVSYVLGRSFVKGNTDPAPAPVAEDTGK